VTSTYTKKDVEALIETALAGYHKSLPGTWWLIECGSSYFCGDGDWCSNPNHARKFKTHEEAQMKAETVNTLEPVRVCDHSWT
jgi:hypothetical protein